MNEKNQITFLVVITLGLAIAVNLIPYLGVFEGEAVVSDYSAVFYADGTLEETFTYKVNAEGKKFLYRFWETRLLLEDNPYSHVKLIDIEAPSGAIRYIKEHTGVTTLFDEGSLNLKSDISRQAYRSEAGAYNPSGYEPGEYIVKYTFKFVPSLEVDDDYVHLNLKLASEHLPYRNVRVAFENPGYIVNSYSHPPTLRRSTDKNMIVFTGSSGEDELLEFEFLMTREALGTLEGIERHVDGVKELTVDANRKYSIEFMTAFTLLWVAKLSGLIVPIWLYRLWNKEGKEQDFVVPPTLSFIPNKGRTPRIVNLVFKKDVADYDEDAFYATMMNLHIRDKISVTPDEKGARVEILDDSGLDLYENKVMEFLRSISPDGVITSRDMARLAESGKNSQAGGIKLYNIQLRYSNLTTGTNDDIAEEFTVNGRGKLFVPALVCLGYVIAMVGLFTFSLLAEWMFLRAAGFALIPLLQIIIAAIFPSTLFGYWKDDNLREKLQWDAFSKHLSDFSQLDRYGPEDVNMWGKWLVYGTALGVGDKVAEAMEMLEIDYAPMRMVRTYPYWFRPITTARVYRSASTGSRGGGGFGGGGGGGFGGGGGSGGGGGGVR